MHRSTIPYWYEDVVTYMGFDWKVVGMKENYRLIRLLGTSKTARVTVATLNLNQN